MKTHLGIIKGFGLSLLLLLLLSAVAISEDSREITVTIVESSSSEGSTEKTVVTTSDSGSGPTETTEIFGEDPTTIGGSDPEDNGNNGDPVPAETPDSQPDDLVIEEFNDDWFKSILAMLDEEEPLSTIDLMQESTDADSFE